MPPGFELVCLFSCLRVTPWKSADVFTHNKLVFYTLHKHFFYTLVQGDHKKISKRVEEEFVCASVCVQVCVNVKFVQACRKRVCFLHASPTCKSWQARQTRILALCLVKFLFLPSRDPHFTQSVCETKRSQQGEKEKGERSFWRPAAIPAACFFQTRRTNSEMWCKTG